MRVRIALWGFAGVLVAAGWWVYVSATAPTPITTSPLLWTLAQFSCPAVLAGTHFHFGVSVYWLLVSNAVAYACVGLLAEMFRSQLPSSDSSAGIS